MQVGLSRILDVFQRDLDTFLRQVKGLSKLQLARLLLGKIAKQNLIHVHKGLYMVCNEEMSS